MAMRKRNCALPSPKPLEAPFEKRNSHAPPVRYLGGQISETSARMECHPASPIRHRRAHRSRGHSYERNQTRPSIQGTPSRRSADSTSHDARTQERLRARCEAAEAHGMDFRASGPCGEIRGEGMSGAETQSRWLCYECGCTCRHHVTHHQNAPRIIVDGWQARYVKLPSTRLRKCLDCGEMKRLGYREKQTL